MRSCDYELAADFYWDLFFEKILNNCEPTCVPQSA